MKRIRASNAAAVNNNNIRITFKTIHLPRLILSQRKTLYGT
jgi:hypothetical protein